jgi:hypothetical protein
MELRFIMRDGKKILQQKHFKSLLFDPKTHEGLPQPGEEWPTEWRDIPLVDDSDLEENKNPPR